MIKCTDAGGNPVSRSLHAVVEEALQMLGEGKFTQSRIAKDMGINPAILCRIARLSRLEPVVRSFLSVDRAPAERISFDTAVLLSGLRSDLQETYARQVLDGLPRSKLELLLKEPSNLHPEAGTGPYEKGQDVEEEIPATSVTPSPLADLRLQAERLAEAARSFSDALDAACTSGALGAEGKGTLAEVAERIGPPLSRLSAAVQDIRK